MALRVLGWHDEAIACQQAAIDRLPTTEHRWTRLVYRLRLAGAHRASGSLATAESGFRDGLATVRSDPALSVHDDFALQHLGKCMLDQGRLDEADVALVDALVIRNRKGDQALIGSTAAALALVGRRRDGARRV